MDLMLLCIMTVKIYNIPYKIYNMEHHNIILKFHPWETCFPENNSDSVNCTYNLGQMTRNGTTYSSIEYLFFYEENPAIGCLFCCFPKSKCLGYHKIDKERLIILMTNDKIDYVYFNAHGRGQGMWLPWNECNKTRNGELIVYVARGSHAFYPEGRIYWRALRFANDLCSNEGESMRINTTTPHDNAIIPNQTSLSNNERFFLPFVLDEIRNRG